MEENCQYGIWKNRLLFHTMPWFWRSWSILATLKPPPWHRRGQGGPPPPPNASNNNFLRKKVIVASVSLVGLLSEREKLFFGFYLIFGTKSALRSVKTFFLFRSKCPKVLNRTVEFDFCGLGPPTKFWLRLCPTINHSLHNCTSYCKFGSNYLFVLASIRKNAKSWDQIHPTIWGVEQEFQFKRFHLHYVCKISTVSKIHIFTLMRKAIGGQVNAKR